MRRYKEGVNRYQSTLLPSQLDDYVDKNNPVRAIDVYVDSLELESLGFTKTQVFDYRHSGQPAYSPGTLLKLYLYGYLNRIRTSRKLERECYRNLEVIWLLEDMKPSYKTIANFRKENSAALRKTHVEFILMCKQLSLFGGEKIAVDGSFFKGNVSKKSFITVKTLNQQIEKMEKQIALWLSEMDASDSEESQEMPGQKELDLSSKLDSIKALMSEKQQKEKEKQALEEAGKIQQSKVDKDAKLLNKRGTTTAGFNVQIVTDAMHKLIVADDVVSDSNDLQQLYPMAKKAKETLDAEAIDVLGDAGYFSGRQIAECQQENITPFVPVPNTKDRDRSNRLSKSQFTYNKEEDFYYCPLGKIVKKLGQPQEQNGSLHQRYRSLKSDCATCEYLGNCASEKAGYREIWRQEHEDIIAEHQERMAKSPNAMKERCALVEHPFGTIKARAGWNHFLVRGLEKVRGEWSLMAMTYNFTRVLNILGMEVFKQHCLNK